MLRQIDNKIHSYKHRRNPAMLVFILILSSFSVQAHHVLGRPSYSLSEDSTTPPGTQIETSVGGFYTTYMVFPAFPVPDKPGRINLYVSRIEDGSPFLGKVTFKIIDGLSVPFGRSSTRHPGI